MSLWLVCLRGLDSRQLLSKNWKSKCPICTECTATRRLWVKCPNKRNFSIENVPFSGFCPNLGCSTVFILIISWAYCRIHNIHVTTVCVNNEVVRSCYSEINEVLHWICWQHRLNSKNIDRWDYHQSRRNFTFKIMLSLSDTKPILLSLINSEKYRWSSPG